MTLFLWKHMTPSGQPALCCDFQANTVMKLFVIKIENDFFEILVAKKRLKLNISF